MLNPGTPIGAYRLVLSCDPALALPDGEEERATALRVARETGDYAPILAPGGAPTYFDMRSIPYAVMQRWTDLRRSAGGPLGPSESMILLFQIALVGVVNFGSVKVERRHDPRVGDKRATDEILDYLRSAAAELGRDPDELVLELAMAVWAREEYSDPKS